MTRINTNISSMMAVSSLSKNNRHLQQSLTRLSTGVRINTGKDDPAGLIASESLRSELRATETAIANAQRGDNIIGTAEGALSEISNLLINMQGLVNSSANTAGLSQAEKDANQLQVDSILGTINRISNSASFEGVKLLNGTFDYTTSSLTTTSAFTSFSINSAKVGSSTLSVAVKVTASAQMGQLNFLGSSAGLSAAATLSIAGNKGTVQLSFAQGTTSTDIAASINQFTDSTGVSAALSSNNKSVKLLSSDYGSNQFVSVSSSNTTAFSTKNLAGVTTGHDYGDNATLTVNGTTTTSNGLAVKVVSANLDATFVLNKDMNAVNKSKTFGITGGGATFSLGAKVDSASLASIGLGRIDTASLGKVLNGTSVLSLTDLSAGRSASLNSGDAALAQKIVDQSIRDIASTRGRLGAFQKNVLSSTINSLNVALENVAASHSAINDTDFASETANLTRSQILASAATNVLSQANTSQQSVLRLLG